jgi:hypothetical protein
MADGSFLCELCVGVNDVQNSGAGFKFSLVLITIAALLTSCSKQAAPEKTFGRGDNPVITDSTNVIPGPAPGRGRSNEVTAPASHQADQLPK